MSKLIKLDPGWFSCLNSLWTSWYECFEMHSFGELFTTNYFRVFCNFFMRFQSSKFTRNLKILNILFTTNYFRVFCNFFMRFQSSKFTRNLKILNIAKYLDHLAISKMKTVLQYVPSVTKSDWFWVHFFSDSFFFLLIMFVTWIKCGLLFQTIGVDDKWLEMDLWESLEENWERKKGDAVWM